jgi:positive regulator of sigma E activity
LSGDFHFAKIAARRTFFMTKFGQVYQYNVNTRVASVRFSRPEACAKCGGCGAGSQQGSITLKADCSVGDWVRVELPEGRFLSATAIAYVVPLVLFLTGLGLGWLLGGGSDLAMLAGSVAGIGLSVGVLYAVNRRIAGKPQWTPRITEVYGAAPDMSRIGCAGE